MSSRSPRTAPSVGSVASTRWRHRDDVVDTRRLAVVEIAEGVAKGFVVAHHYSHSYPAAKLRYGLVDHHTDRLLRVAALAD